MMIGYYFGLGLRHLRRNPILTTLMILTLACGIAASMSTLTVLRAMAADPLPSKSDRVITPLVDIRPDDGDNEEIEPPYQLTYRDAIALHAAKKGVRQAALYQIGPIIESSLPNVTPIFDRGLATHADLFAMVDATFVRGGPWSAADDERGANVVVLKEKIADKLFGATDPIGQTVRLENKDFRVVGVVANDWEPEPQFYRMIGGSGAFSETIGVLVPLAAAVALEWPQQASVNCYADDPNAGTYSGLMQSECVWMALWIELQSSAEIPAFKDFLVGYQAEQRKLGRLPRPDNHRVLDVNAWLAAMKIVSQDARTQTYLAFGFLLVCLVNVIGLLLAKFTARSGEIGVRRALGARRVSVFQQYLTEAAVIGFVGGIAGLGLTYGSLWLIGKQSEQLARLAKMDWVMLAATIGLAIVSSLIAGLLPTWRAMQVQPALQLKSQ
jgi:putative ABC transport system permease protein